MIRREISCLPSGTLGILPAGSAVSAGVGGSGEYSASQGIAASIPAVFRKPRLDFAMETVWSNCVNGAIPSSAKGQVSELEVRAELDSPRLRESVTVGALSKAG